jgi:hypothetical protein
MSIDSAAGSVLAFNIATPKFADLAAGNAYAIVLVNTTAADITAGTVTIEAADAKADDPCAPDVWAPLKVIPDCDAPLGTVSTNAVITISAQHPIKAMSQCSYAIPCPKQFIRATAPPAGIDALAVVTRLKRTA